MSNNLVKNLEDYSIKDIGYVYVIEDKQKGAVKIGRSVRPKQRIRDIKLIACVEGREYISHKILGMSTIESSAHKALAEYCISSEWFNISFKKAVEIVNDLLPKEVTNEQIEFLQQKEKESTARAVKFMEQAISPNIPKPNIVEGKVEAENIREFAKEIVKEINDALNEQQSVVNKAYETYMDKLDEICTKYGIISDEVMTVAQQNKVSALVDYTFLMRKNCQLPITPCYETNAHRRCLISEVREQNDAIKEWIHMNRLKNTH